jgi:hypothetical protein
VRSRLAMPKKKAKRKPAAAAAAASPSGDDIPLETRTERRAREQREVRLHYCTRIDH